MPLQVRLTPLKTTTLKVLKIGGFDRESKGTQDLFKKNKALKTHSTLHSADNKVLFYLKYFLVKSCCWTDQNDSDSGPCAASFSPLTTAP